MTDRAQAVAAVIEQIAGIARELAAPRRTPFGEHRLSRSQLDALLVLSHSLAPVTAGDLADALTVTPGAVSQLVAGLRSVGLVESVTPEGDARVRVIRLTPSARVRIDAWEREVVARLSPRFDALDDRELERLAQLLGKGGGPADPAAGAASARRVARLP